MGEVLLNKHSSSTWTAMQPIIIQHMLSSPYAQRNSSVLGIHKWKYFNELDFTFSCLTKPVANMLTPKQSNSFEECKATNLIMGVICVPSAMFLNVLYWTSVIRVCFQNIRLRIPRILRQKIIPENHTSVLCQIALINSARYAKTLNTRVQI